MKVQPGRWVTGAICVLAVGLAYTLIMLGHVQSLFPRAALFGASTAGIAQGLFGLTEIFQKVLGRSKPQGTTTEA